MGGSHENPSSSVRLLARSARRSARAAHADVVTDWNEVAVARLVAARQLPPDGARAVAMMHVAMFDAINAVQPRYTAYAFKGKAPAGRIGRGGGRRSGADRAAEALSRPERGDREGVRRVARAIPDGAGKSAGIALGEQVGNECVAMRANDGVGATVAYRPATAAGVYVPTMIPASVDWPNVKPFFMKEPAQFRPARRRRSRAPSGRRT